MWGTVWNVLKGVGMKKLGGETILKVACMLNIGVGALNRGDCDLLTNRAILVAVRDILLS